MPASSQWPFHHPKYWGHFKTWKWSLKRHTQRGHNRKNLVPTFDVGTKLFFAISPNPRDPGSPFENGFMEAKYLAFWRWWLCTHCSSSDVRWLDPYGKWRCIFQTEPTHISEHIFLTSNPWDFCWKTDSNHPNQTVSPRQGGPYKWTKIPG